MFQRLILLMNYLLIFFLIGCKENSVEPNSKDIKITKITNLSNFGVYTAKLTPNKSRVIYSFSEDFGMNYEIRICDINGNSDKQLIKMGHIQYFAISKDETKFAFLSSPDGAIDALYLLDVPSNQITKLAEDESSVDTAYFPVAFSSNNNKILVNAYYYINSVYLFDVSSKTVLNLTGDINSYPISFSPDGNEILYNTNDKLCLVNTNGTNDRVILDGYNINYNCIGFTPDGNSIIFSALKSGGRNIYKVDKDGSNLIEITSDSLDNYVNDVSLDGKSILYTSNKNTNNYLRMNIFLDNEGNEKMLVGSDYDDRGIGFTNIPGKVLITRSNSPNEQNNIYLVEY